MPHAFRSRDNLTEWHEDAVRAALREILAAVTSVAAKRLPCCALVAGS